MAFKCCGTTIAQRAKPMNMMSYLHYTTPPRLTCRSYRHKTKNAVGTESAIARWYPDAELFVPSRGRRQATTASIAEDNNRRRMKPTRVRAHRYSKPENVTCFGDCAMKWAQREIYSRLASPAKACCSFSSSYGGTLFLPNTKGRWGITQQ